MPDKKTKQRSRSTVPFGEPDGQRAEIEDSFINFQSRSGWGGIATGERDAETRLLIGRKGSGKTVYMRRLREIAAKEPSQHADDVQYVPPDTDTILNFSRLISGNESQLEWWTKLWDRCILRSVASHILAGALSTYVDAETLDRLRQFQQTDRGRLLRAFNGPVSVYRQMHEIVSSYHSRNSLFDFLQSYYWADFEGILAGALQKAPPVFLFLDALDEHFERSPRWWLKCQEGLFCETVRLQRSNQWNRLHLVVSLRDIVHASIMRSEHRSRFTTDPRIKMLNWHRRSLEEFLAVKLSRLEKQYVVAHSNGSRTVANWLGMECIPNPRRGTEEPILQYLLRHTRMLPRDLVILGNSLCECIERREETERSFDEDVRRCVHENAAVFGGEQLQICANEIVSNYMPRCADDNCRDAFTGNDDFTASVASELEALISKIGIDRFPKSTIEANQGAAEAEFGCDVFSLMWRNGLIGYIDGSSANERSIFYDQDSSNSFRLPSDCKEYVFHPIAIDATGIRAVGHRPVVPYSG